LPKGISKLKRLQELKLAGNNFTKEEIAELKKWMPEISIITDRIFTSFKDALKSPNKVDILFLNHHKLNSLSRDIHKLTNLKELHLANNNIKSLPKEIGRLINLEALDISNNQISRFPKEFSTLSKLEKLIITGNKFSNKTLDSLAKSNPNLKVIN